MTKYKCIIVDDEPIAIRVIKSHLSNFPEFEIVAECNNALEAMKVLRAQSIDLAFLDIEMPLLTGVEMVKSMGQMPAVIFTTAHRNYAVEAFQVRALDYLLKPVSLERFIQAINRFLDLHQSIVQETGTRQEEDWLMLKVDKKHVKVDYNDINYIESMADYVIVHTLDQKWITKERISQLDEKLPSELFIRVHRGYIVNKKAVTAWFGNTLELKEVKIPVGRNYKDQVNQLLGIK